MIKPFYRSNIMSFFRAHTEFDSFFCGGLVYFGDARLHHSCVIHFRGRRLRVPEPM